MSMNCRHCSNRLVYSFAVLTLLVGTPATQAVQVEATRLLNAPMLAQADPLAEAAALDQRAEQLYQDGNYGEAIPLAERSLQLRQRALPPDDPGIAASLNNLAGLYQAQGRLDEAEPLYQQALQIRQQSLPATHPAIAASLHSLALLYLDQGRLDEAEPLYQQALQIRQQSLPPTHPHIAQSLDNLAVLYLEQEQPERALSLLTQAATIAEHNLTQLLAIGNESRKLAYLTTLSKSTNGIISHSIDLGNTQPAFTRLALETLLRRKGRVLDAVTDTTRILRQQLGDDPTIQQQLSDLLELRTSLINLLTQGQGDRSPEEFSDEYNKLNQQIEQLEIELGNQSSAFQLENTPVTIEQVQALIPATAVLVEITRYQPFDLQAASNQRWGAPRYAAYILPATGEPQVVDLGDAAAIDATVSQFRTLLSNRTSTSALQQTARDLDAKLLDPLAPWLGDRTHLLLSPDGNLNLMPFEALINAQGQYRLEQYDFSYLTSGRDLVRLQLPAAASQAPVIVANPDYNQAQPALVATRLAESQDSVVPSDRSLDSQDSADLSALSFSPLPGTEAEGTAIHRLLPTATLLSQTQATKDRLQRLPNPHILHIATHGFFLPGTQVDLLPPEFSPTVTANSRASTLTIANPLLRAGLALAGANARAAATNAQAAATEDIPRGILTASELAGLDLLGTQLVVLSACETGLGQTSTSEGVYGLRRALAMAGTRSQVVSLWRVNDAVTETLMTTYYTHLLRDQMGRHAALKAAQLALLNSETYSHPYYWAAFIPSGDWQPLPPP